LRDDWRTIITTTTTTKGVMMVVRVVVVVVVVPRYANASGTSSSVMARKGREELGNTSVC